MEIRPYKRSKNRHSVRLDSSTECLVLADGLTNSDYRLTPETIDRVGAVANLRTNLTDLSNTDNFPQTITVTIKYLALIASGLFGKFDVLSEPRHINDPTYNEVGEDISTITIRYLEAQSIPLPVN